nr:hypothetical protein [Tanacetum cinerariifolium]
QDDIGTRLDLGSYKESLEVEKTVVEQPVNDIKEEGESAEDDYELKKRVKGKHVKESRHTPLPTTIKSPRIHTTLIYSDTEKHQDLTVIDPTPSSSSPKPSSFLKPSYSLQPKTRRFKQYKIMQELLPSMVNSQVKEDTKTTNHVYVAEGLILERQKMQVKVSQMFTDAIQRERENIRVGFTLQINNLQQDDLLIWLALKIMFEGLIANNTSLRSSVIRPRDQDDHHNDVYLKGENSVKR